VIVVRRNPATAGFLFRLRAGGFTGKIVLIVLDGVGVGALPDAARFGDAGSDTLGHTAEAVGGLSLPNMAGMGLGNVAPVRGVPPSASPSAFHGRMREVSRGKDSTTGHWEIGGIILEREFPTFPQGFPEEVITRFLELTGSGGCLGNCTASGTAIIEELGVEHLRSGRPIVYTSADSVFQIAAHERVLSLEKLYEMCGVTRERVCVGPAAVGRVIARPFTGEPGAFIRTAGRKDFSLPPPAPTMLDVLRDAGIRTVGIGKIEDLFAGRGLDTAIHTASNDEGIAGTIAAAGQLDRGLVFTNLVDFDMLYGHRNDARGFADALERFDAAIPAIRSTLRPGDLLVLTADHGNDPVTPGTDHTREYVPLLCLREGVAAGGPLGTRATFADLGRTVTAYFGLDGSLDGTSFLDLLGGRPA
jgi:phosphopentomutase